ncbi:MAG: LysR substrate-binding domain-containing protein [Neisseria sp.]|uniref:LysR substrate-binding domain-containing protein n=1 Tax=Neisseria sp. TaxID=192066 RepID=UPI0026DCA98C|nr:LysR substrate-binding domain-containing protein [Neisseria sp.]MDO4641444.1 LysR substrate-binding domain-containing protein [Neisseria sp.]
MNAGAVDLAVRYGSGHYPGIRCEALFQEVFAPVTSPNLLANLTDNIQQWPLIHFDWHYALDAANWPAWAKAAGVRLDTAGGTRYSDASHTIQAAVAGQGVALLGLKLVAAELAAGLLKVAAEPVLPAQFYWLCESERMRYGEAVQKVKSWLLAQCR